MNLEKYLMIGYSEENKPYQLFFTRKCYIHKIIFHKKTKMWNWNIFEINYFNIILI